MVKVKRSVDDRKGYLGGSSWGAALGLSTYKTARQVAEEYLGTFVEEVDAETQKRFDMGHALEDFIAKQAEREYGVKLKKSNYLYISDKDKRLGCHPDRLAVGRNLAVEIKSSSAFDGRWGEEGTAEIPYDYLLQVYSYFECVGVKEMWLVRFSNNRLSRYVIERPSDEILSGICEKLIAFMDDADKGIMPEPVSYKEAVSSYKEPEEGDIVADSAMNDAMQKWYAIKAEKRRLDEEEDRCKTEIVNFLSSNQKSRLVDDNGKKLCQYITVETSRLDSKRLKAEMPDLYEQYSYTSSSTSLR